MTDTFYDDEYFESAFLDSFCGSSELDGSARAESNELEAFDMLDCNTESLSNDDSVSMTLNVPEDNKDDETVVEDDDTLPQQQQQQQQQQQLQHQQQGNEINQAMPQYFEYDYYVQHPNQNNVAPVNFQMNMPMPGVVMNFQNTMPQPMTLPQWAPNPVVPQNGEITGPNLTNINQQNQSMTAEAMEVSTRFLAGKRRCPLCSKEFKVSHGLRGHYTRVHMRQKRFTCTVCNLGFWSNSDLERHMPRHTGQRFTCDTCDRTYTSKQRLTEHFRNPSSCWLDPVLLKHINDNSDSQQLI